MRSKYNALDFSNEIIHIANDNELLINYQQLRVVMYYIQGTYIKHYNLKAFSDPLECWVYGPTVVKVWSACKSFGRQPLFSDKQCNIQLSQEEHDLILSILIDFLNRNVWDLIDKIQEESPWIQAKHRNSKFLSDQDMKDYFTHEE